METQLINKWVEEFNLSRAPLSPIPGYRGQLN